MPDDVTPTVLESVRHLLLAAGGWTPGTLRGGAPLIVAGSSWRVARAGPDGVRLVALAGLNAQRPDAASYPLDHGLRDEIRVRLSPGANPTITGVERLATAWSDPGEPPSFSVHRLLVTFTPVNGNP